MSKRSLFLVTLCIGVGLTAYAATGPSFRPDFVFKGAALTGWTEIGSADWRAQDGEIVGTPKSASGGFLILNRSFEDVGVFSNISCEAGCNAGVLLRAERTADGGMKGILVSVADGRIESSSVTVSAQGGEISRVPLPARGAGGGGGGGGGGRRGGGGGAQPVVLPPGVTLPDLARRGGAYVPGQPNALDITLVQDGLTLKLNGVAPANAGGGAANAEFGRYGPIALYVGGTAPARFKDVAYQDFHARPFDAEKVSPNFRVHRLSEFYYSYSTAIGDLNRDGNPDVIAGPYYYAGPDFTVGRQLYVPESFNPTSQWPIPSMVQFASDFTGDGWPDVLTISGNAGRGTGTLLVNPKGESRRWDKVVVMQAPERVIGGEDTLFKDMDGDGKPEIVHTGQGAFQYSKPDAANPLGPWVTTTITAAGPWAGGHGLGAGDINGDGRIDMVSPYGWFEQPPKGSTALWAYHPAELGRNGTGGAEMAVYDVNGDGLNDIVTALEAHLFGTAWYEQKKDASGKISFVRHMIMDSALDRNAGDVWFTQPHATGFADINGDGVLDFIVGKRHHAHFGYSDPDNFSMPVLYAYKVVRNKQAPGGAEFVPELISNRSGIGSRITMADLNKDGTPDVTVSGASGTFIFFNQTKKGSR